MSDSVLPGKLKFGMRVVQDEEKGMKSSPVLKAVEK